MTVAFLLDSLSKIDMLHAEELSSRVDPKSALTELPQKRSLFGGR